MIRVEEYGFPKRTSFNWMNAVLSDKQRDGYKPLVVVLLEEMDVLFEYFAYLELPSTNKLKSEHYSFFNHLTLVLGDFNSLIERREIKDEDIIANTKNADIKSLLEIRFGKDFEIQSFPNIGGKRTKRKRGNSETYMLRTEQPFYSFIRVVFFLIKKTNRITLI